MTVPIAGVPYEARYSPTANGQPYDPALAGGAVLRLEVLTFDNPPSRVADVGPAVKAGSADYVFPAVTLAAGSYATRITWTPAAGAAAVIDSDQQLVVAALGGSLGEAGPEWLPTPKAVRDEMPGREQALSKVTDATISAMLVRAWKSLAAELPDVLAPRLHAVARQYLVFSVAARLEDQIFPEQSSLDGSNAERLDRLAGAELARLRTALGRTDGGTAETDYWSGTVAIGRVG